MTDRITKLTSQFTSISLADLNAQAALQTRRDNKYILSWERFVDFANAIQSSYRVLEIDGKRRFSYDTRYFDTPDLVSYWSHIQGRRKRFKCRSRHYLDSGLCVFEVKLKSGRGETVKYKINYTEDECLRVTPAAEAFLKTRVHDEYGVVLEAALESALLTHYERVTFGNNNAERVTCDLNLAFSVDGVQQGEILPGHVLIETKSERGRSDTDRLLWQLGARPTEGSKYCLGLSLARPELRHNPFHSTRKSFFMRSDAQQPVMPTPSAVRHERSAPHTLVPVLAPIPSASMFSEQ